MGDVRPDKAGRKGAKEGGGGHRELADVTWVHSLAIGLAQAAALIPDVSRSSGTITCALFLGFGRPDAARFLFLLGIPAVAGPRVFELEDAAQALGRDSWAALVVGTLPRRSPDT